MISSPPCPQCSVTARTFWPTVDAWRCPGCDLRFRAPLPNPDELAAFYKQVWQRPKESSYTGATTDDLARVYVERLQHQPGIGPLAGQRLLEFGAGQGAMLRAFSAVGADVQAVEPYGIDYLRQQGFTVSPSLADLAEQSPVPLDGIYTVQVVEHLTQPWETLTELMSWLKPGGWLYVSTIHAGSLNARLRKAQWREVQNRTHLIFFTPRCLEAMLFAAGGQRVARVNSFIRYPEHRPWQHTQDWLLQQAGLGGELCYLARKAQAA